MSRRRKKIALKKFSVWLDSKDFSAAAKYIYPAELPGEARLFFSYDNGKTYSFGCSVYDVKFFAKGLTNGPA